MLVPFIAFAHTVDVVSSYVVSSAAPTDDKKSSAEETTATPVVDSNVGFGFVDSASTVDVAPHPQSVEQQGSNHPVANVVAATVSTDDDIVASNNANDCPQPMDVD